jgi:predicted ATPase
MLRKMRISNFKCFEELELSLAPLTLLSGVNGGGKSSVIQALVLLSQTMEEREWGRGLLLEGPALSLGTVSDVLNQRASRKKIVFDLEAEGERIVWTFKAEDRRSLLAELDSVEIDGQPVVLGEIIRWLLPSERAFESKVVKEIKNLEWITAERIGPREILPLLDEEGHSRVGRFGELAAGLLYWHGEEEVGQGVCLPDIPSTLLHQVKGQMRNFFPDCDLQISPIEGASAITLRLRTDKRSDFQRPQNVGFGLTQLLPIIVALLSSRSGDILLFENPETHLHPRAQQEIGELIARTAASGVQIITETHSDHVLNGIRLAVKNEVISNSDVVLHFFSPSRKNETSSPLSPKIDRDGRLDIWPEGFFDQFDIALSKLL